MCPLLLPLLLEGCCYTGQVFLQMTLSLEFPTHAAACDTPLPRCEFMPFGGFRSAMNAAGDNVPPDALVSMADHGSINTAKADLLEPPLAKEVEVVYICFDMLFMGDESIINRPLQVGGGWR